MIPIFAISRLGVALLFGATLLISAPASAQSPEDIRQFRMICNSPNLQKEVHARAKKRASLRISNWRSKSVARRSICHRRRSMTPPIPRPKQAIPVGSIRLVTVATDAPSSAAAVTARYAYGTLRQASRSAGSSWPNPIPPGRRRVLSVP